MRFQPHVVSRRVAFVALLFLAGFSLAMAPEIRSGLQSLAFTAQSGERSGYQPSGQVIAGRQLELVYVGASTCGWSNLPGLAEAVETLKMRLNEYARERDMTFRAVGVAVDLDAEKGLDHLRGIGQFDEVSSGYGWGNAQAVRYMWADSLVRPATPQILIYTRTVGSATGDEVPLATLYRDQDRELIAAIRGPNRIKSVATAQSLREGVRIHNLIRRSGPSPALDP